MKKEIEVFILKNHLPWFLDSCDSITIHKYEQSAPTVKCKLIIEVPEKKIEITESQLERAFLEDHVIYDQKWMREIDKVKQKLFGKQE